MRVLPEEPLRNGCVPPMTVVDNLNLRSFDLGPKKSHRGWLDRAGMAARAKDMIAAYGIRTPSPQAPIGVLSGGNVQRCVLARELDGDVRLLIVANPCFGLDVKAVAENSGAHHGGAQRRHRGIADFRRSGRNPGTRAIESLLCMKAGSPMRCPPRAPTRKRSAAICLDTTDRKLLFPPSSIAERSPTSNSPCQDCVFQSVKLDA